MVLAVLSCNVGPRLGSLIHVFSVGHDFCQLGKRVAECT